MGMDVIKKNRSFFFLGMKKKSYLLCKSVCVCVCVL